MKTFFKCTKCPFSAMVASVDPDGGLLCDLPCPATCDGKLKRVKKAPVGVKYFAARELFAQCMGVGAKQERNCSAAYLNKTFAGDVVVALDLTDLEGKNRVVVNSITFKSGRAVHFATSTQGATIYKVTRELIDER